MNLPNSLTLSRIFLVPLLVVVLLTGRFEEREIWWGFIVFLTAALTDYFDGYLARKRQQVTTLGKLLDPIADKLLISSAFISLVALGIASAWMVVIIIGREFAVSGLRSIASAEGFTIDASKLGKSKMASQVVCISLLILGRRFPETFLYPAGRFLLWLVVVLAIVSMIHYFRRFWSQIDESIKYRKRRAYRRPIRILRRQRKGPTAAIDAGRAS
ncbi:CDP-diacylglycerol--glycerol-3-phosphate 3-phosphatidyltransferase [Acidobacteria bacterium AH-259-G07]|nr:CDP-diacylglycerol--glycerol-3-phosphate 3-phosphatidyltransferase [Acidobacteria bacterium AH-259-G07]MDA2937520.1 CDP-diacylglycerol--glycerol-3-phosphate 3-phosphatidyltransferase [Acidobacteria bacterium AH-259-A15]